ncbi:MAG: hypothetical protein WDN08_17850 [Rhizomicrobium sp.]
MALKAGWRLTWPRNEAKVPFPDGADRLDRLIRGVKDRQFSQAHMAPEPKTVSNAFAVSPEETWSKKYMTAGIGPNEFKPIQMPVVPVAMPPAAAQPLKPAPMALEPAMEVQAPRSKAAAPAAKAAAARSPRRPASRRRHRPGPGQAAAQIVLVRPPGQR